MYVTKICICVSELLSIFDKIKIISPPIKAINAIIDWGNLILHANLQIAVQNWNCSVLFAKLENVNEIIKKVYKDYNAFNQSVSDTFISVKQLKGR